MALDPRFDVDKITEEVNTKNVLAVITHARLTRELVDTQQETITYLANEVLGLREQVVNLASQVGFLRGQVLGGGPTA